LNIRFSSHKDLNTVDALKLLTQLMEREMMSTVPMYQEVLKILALLKYSRGR
jgi:hypothetical protein